MIQDLKNEYLETLKQFIEETEKKEEEKTQRLRTRNKKQEGYIFVCDICGYQWKSRKNRDAKDIQMCPSCKSPFWNILKSMQKKYGVFYEKMPEDVINGLKENYSWLVQREIRQWLNPYAKLYNLKKINEQNKKKRKEYETLVTDYGLYIIETEKDIQRLEEQIQKLEAKEK